MDIQEICRVASSWLSPYLVELSSAFVMTLLAIYGNDLNRIVRQKTKPYPLVVRTIVFILFISFGYGFLAVLLLPYVQLALKSFGSIYLAPVTLAFFLLISFLASRKNQI